MKQNPTIFSRKENRSIIYLNHNFLDFLFFAFFLHEENYFSMLHNVTPILVARHFLVKFCNENITDQTKIQKYSNKTVLIKHIKTINKTVYFNASLPNSRSFIEGLNHLSKLSRIKECEIIDFSHYVGIFQKKYLNNIKLTIPTLTIKAQTLLNTNRQKMVNSPILASKKQFRDVSYLTDDSA
ncbi:hypothetical protein BpHYR1_032782 [Brachionus plicatilis]|uniref:Uncharacterized protein n=1 Tax=Brachionus plicatilis TaxID=10195 RepID=A0A3M7SST7_BRAPC|nr:hypothetical protein BpHYR1_032782 [Brachionus plicatilis]